MTLLSLIIALGSSLIYILQSIIKMNNFENINRILSALIAIICMITFIYYILKNKKINKKMIVISFGIIILLLLYYMTKVRYGYWNENYRTQLLMFGVHVIPAILMGGLLAEKRLLGKMIKWLQPMVILYTIAIFIAVLSSDVLNSTKGVQAFNENGLNYQTISYYIVLAFAINLFIIINNKKIDQFRLFKNKFWICLDYVFIGIQVFCLLSAGGRGGVVLFTFFVIYFITIYHKKIHLNYRNIIYILVISLLVIVGIKILINIPYIKVGLDRVLGFFFAENDKIINDYRITYHAAEAIKSFYNNPILGDGLGSAFYKFNIYTHNIFTDVLVEGGLIYFSIVICILLLFFNKSFKCLKYNYEINIILIIFFSSFIMLLFSGYYLNETGIWFAIGYIYIYHCRIKKVSMTRK